MQEDTVKMDEALYKKLLDDLLEPFGLKTHQGKVQSSFQDLHTEGIFLKDARTGAVCRVADVLAPVKYLVCRSYERFAKSM